MNVIDQIVGYFSPQAAVKRGRARLQMEAVRRFEGAQAGRRTQKWLARETSINAELWADLPKLRARHRDLVQNNVWAARAIQSIENNTVGAGILARIGARTSSRQKTLRALWSSWAETTQCDADGRYDIYGLQALIIRTVAESGECLIRRRVRRPSDGLAVPLQIQVLEPDYLDAQKNQDNTPGGGRIVQGIETDAIGRRVAYWMYQNHPGERSIFTLDSRRVPASEIAHVYRVDRPGQMRGYPWGSQAIMRMRDLDDYEDAYLLRQKIANMFTAFVYETEPGSTENENDLTESLEPGAVEILPPGTDVKFAEPPSTDSYGPFTQAQHRGIASAYGITYESLTGDYSRVNFSSGRMGFIEFHRNIDKWRWQIIIPQFCTPISNWFEDAIIMSGQGDLIDNTSWEWTPPRREMVDPTREIPAQRDAVRAGMISLSETIRRNGYDPETVLNELASDTKLLDKLGLLLDSDPRADKGRNDSMSNETTTARPATNTT